LRRPQVHERPFGLGGVAPGTHSAEPPELLALATIPARFGSPVISHVQLEA